MSLRAHKDAPERTPVLTVLPAAAGERRTIENLLQLYTHDFSEYWAGGDKGELAEDGRFAPYPLDAYWSDPDHIPLLVRIDGFIAGFVLLNRNARSGVEADYCVAEFFIVRKHRNGGMGTRVAHAVFEGRPGWWEIAVARRNTRAQAFWKRAVESYRGATDIEEMEVLNFNWNGPVLRFRVGAARP